MTLHDWINRTGPKEVAKTLGVDPSTVSQWRTYRACPRPRYMLAIHKLSKGEVSYESMVVRFVKKNNNRKHNS